MIRFVMALSVACLIAGCGDDADTDKKDDKDASTTPATAKEDIAKADPADADEDQAVAKKDDESAQKTEEAAQETKEAEVRTVKFKVPGMT